MIEDNAFEKEQKELREKFYYNPSYGDKLIRFYIEMTQNGVWSVETIKADEVDNDSLPF